MEDRTFTYLQGRFRDYYRKVDLDLPPEIENREWGYIPWTQDGGTRMVRHKSLLELGDPEEFLPQEHPQHVYASASKYEEPGAPTMDAKRWTGSDLVFDIDIDDAHLPETIESADDLDHAAMLGLAKDHLLRLLEFLENDFGFEDIEIVFSGGRGYHVHVRDDHIQQMDSQTRTELVSYVRGVNLDLDALTREKWTTAGTPAGGSALSFKPDGGWSSRVHEHIVDAMDEYLAIAEEYHRDKAIEDMVDEYNGIGEDTAENVLDAFDDHQNAIRAGHINPAKGVKRFARAATTRIHEETYAEIDEPVTTDINRLIRLPGSLHGGHGLVVTRIPRDEVEDFDPLADAVPDAFTGRDIKVTVTEPTTVTMMDETFEFDEGPTQVPEAVGIYMMARGVAEKDTE